MKIDSSLYLHAFKSKNIAIITLLGFASGLPLALTSGTLQAWMTVEGIDLRTIGIFSLVGIPYTLKFFWSPIMDRFVPPLLGRRRGWIIITQMSLITGISFMAFISPQHAPLFLAVLALMVAFSSASQDIVIDAYRTDILREREHERGVGAAVFVMGYRIAVLVSGALALLLSEYIFWRNTYLLMAGLMGVGMIATLFGKEPDTKTVPPYSLQEAIVGPMKDYFSRDSAILLLAFIIFYKLGDAYAGTLTTPFLIRGIGFSVGEVGTINKGLGFISLIF